jgi:hypothetical protein
VSAVSWAIETGYQPNQCPFSFFADVGGMNKTDWWGDASEGVVNTPIGVRYAFGGGSLKSRATRYNQATGLSSFSWLRNDGNWQTQKSFQIEMKGRIAMIWLFFFTLTIKLRAQLRHSRSSFHRSLT